jgi:hypothetical protein
MIRGGVLRLPGPRPNPGIEADSIEAMVLCGRFVRKHEGKTDHRSTLTGKHLAGQVGA